jgi:hypothetical protein
MIGKIESYLSCYFFLSSDGQKKKLHISQVRKLNLVGAVVLEDGTVKSCDDYEWSMIADGKTYRFVTKSLFLAEQMGEGWIDLIEVSKP